MAAVKNAPDTRLERRSSTSSARLGRRISVPPRLDKRNSLPSPKPESSNDRSAVAVDKNNHWTNISPALYAIPKSTPIPADAPSSYPPSPYIINHKRRGPGLLKSFSEVDVATTQRALDEQQEADSEKKVTSQDDSSILRSTIDSRKDSQLTFADHSPVKEESLNDIFHRVKEKHGDVNVNHHVTQENVNGPCNGEFQGCEVATVSDGKKGIEESVLGEVDDFVDPLYSMSAKNKKESKPKGRIERAMSLTTPVAEFYDAWEELTSEGAPPPPDPDIEAKLCEIRFSLLMESERRKQAEEAINNMRTQWQKSRVQLSSVGLTFPGDPLAAMENEQLDGHVEDLIQQVNLARFVSSSIGRGEAKAEVEMEMEAQLELKNFAIARLWDKLHYYEAVNREMSQRNQEAVDTARRLRQKRKRRQRWLWGSLTAAITLSSAVLAWSYLSSEKGTSSSDESCGSEDYRASKH